MSKEIEGGGEQISGGQGADWDVLKKVPFAGFGSQERQKLHEEGRIKDTGAYVLNDKMEVVGVAPSLPEKYEKTNMKYGRTMGGELEFLQNYLDDKRTFLEAEGEKVVLGDVLDAFEERREQEMRLGLETQYVADLTRYFRTADGATLADLSKGDIVFEKIKSDIARTGKEVSPDEVGQEALARRKAQQRIFGVLRAKFEHGARFEGSDEGFVPVYDESEDDNKAEPVSEGSDELEQVLEPVGAAPGYSQRKSGKNEAFSWRIPKDDEMREAEQRRNRRFEEEKRRREAQEEQEMEQEEELGMEM